MSYKQNKQKLILIQAMLTDEFDFYGLSINPRQIELWADELEKMDLEIMQIKAAIQKSRKDEARSKPANPAQILDIIFNYPTADEAWAMIPHDEQGSVIWHEEARLAFGEARPLLIQGDPVAARMAFKAAYARQVQLSKELKRPPKWSPSFGSSKSGQEDAIKQALIKGRITEQEAQTLRPEFTLPAGNKLQITSSQTAENTGPTEVGIESLSKIKELLKTKTIPTDIETSEEERKRIAEAKEKAKKAWRDNFETKI